MGLVNNCPFYAQISENILRCEIDLNLTMSYLAALGWPTFSADKLHKVSLYIPYELPYLQQK